MANPTNTRAKKTERRSAEAAPRVDHADATAKHFLLFEIAGGSFGMPLASIAEIIRVPKLSYMPLVPPSLLGLANLRGAVVPAISLRRLLHLPDAAADDTTRMIVLNGTAPVGFVVDRIDRLVAVPAERLDHDDAGAGDIDPAVIDSVIRGAEGQEPTKILDSARLISGQFTQLGVTGSRDAGRSAVALGAAGAVETKTLTSLLSFDLGAQEYALPLDSVREIVALPDHVSEVPRAEAAVLGVVTLRNRLLPLVSLRALLGLPVDGMRAQSAKVIVVSMGDASIGVVVDATREILRVDPAQIDTAPTLLSRGEGEADVTSICRLDQGRRLVAVLSPDRLFRSDLVSRILAEQGGAIDGKDVQPGTAAMADEQFIVFRLGGQDYALPIAAVGEIVRPPEHITRVPKAPAFIDGVINLRGSVLPIVDLRRRFDVVAAGNRASQRILVLGIAGARAGFLVDSVAEVLKVPTGSIQPAPEMSPDQMRLISRVINLEDTGRMILLVDSAQLLDQVESDVIAKFESEQLDQTTTST
jgi:purine-binding chemotaxis protein CheW